METDDEMQLVHPDLVLWLGGVSSDFVRVKINAPIDDLGEPPDRACGWLRNEGCAYAWVLEDGTVVHRNS